MPSKKETKKIKKKLAISNTLRQYFPSLLIKYNQHLDQLPRETNSTDENLMSVFRIMWSTNLLLKTVIDGNAVGDASHNNISWIQMEETLKELHKIFWKLNSLIIHEFQFQP
ncbi:uncharacterized protein LOC111035442 [Myzus persicae]|uniref:uncharacterized protein LOC111035442 n=1 Tax=Myzus persicae TaxID=13164 RepID=UPI000B930E29|nr:uncharacterized protein LOC111035442 [Myzus persicae]